MITPQYTYDNSGKKIGVFLAIDDWNELEQIPAVQDMAHSGPAIPDWQIVLGKKELENIATGNTELMTWPDAKEKFKL